MLGIVLVLVLVLDIVFVLDIALVLGIALAGCSPDASAGANRKARHGSVLRSGGYTPGVVRLHLWIPSGETISSERAAPPLRSVPGRRSKPCERASD